MPEDVLAAIVRAVETRLARRPAEPDLEAQALRARARREREGSRSLRKALAAPGLSIIAECKRKSPSAGVLRDPFDPVALAVAYAQGGARAISVVTEPDFFGGDPSWIGSVRRAVSLPVLRKDFIISPRQLLETAVLGADAVLLIARILDDRMLQTLVQLASELGLEVLLELFIDEDPSRAVEAAVPMIGVNARNLKTFDIDLRAVERLGAVLPSGRPWVAESGIHGADDLQRLAAAGYDGFLIGEHLVTSVDPASEVHTLLTS